MIYNKIGDKMRHNVFRLIKMIVGFAIGMLIAMLFKLPYFYTAGVIVILSLEATRKSSLEIGLKRVIASLLGLLLSVLLFYIFGFHIWVLFVFVAVFISLAFLLKIEQGIVVSLVLVSQIYLESNINFSLNALYILLIGIIVAFLLNLYMPVDPKIVLEMSEIDHDLNTLIQEIAICNEVSFEPITNKLNTTYQNIKTELENMNLPLTVMRLKYVEMRFEQVNVLKRIKIILDSVPLIPEKTIILDFLKEFNNMIGYDNYAEPLSIRLREIFDYFRTTNLPENREVFEKRAQLYFVLLEIENFLNLKLIFHKNNEV